MSHLDEFLSRSLPERPCEVTVRGGRECGEPSVAVVLRKRVCAGHKDSAQAGAEIVSRVLRGDS